MLKTDRRLVVALWILSYANLLAAADSKPNATKPNIILVMADDQGWGDVGYNGHPFVKTPELDAMAREGFVLDRFYAAAPVCSPTRASVMTGRNPIRTKVTNHGRYMRPHEQTIAETLQAAGYVTGIFGKVHLGSGQPDSPCNPSVMGFDEWIIGLNFYDNDPYLSRNGTIEHRTGKGSVLAMDDALAFLNKHKNNEQPLFAVVWFPSPHDPHKEVPDGQTLYADKKHAGYYREITLLDQQVGRLRRGLRDMNLADNTIVWYCSDNGGLVNATSGGRQRKGSIYEGGLRIPGIIEWPARKLSGRTAVPTWTCDIYPTLLSMAGIDHQPPHELDGIDISPIIAGKINKRSKPMGFWHNFQPGQATWSDRIQKAIMEMQQSGAPLPHNQRRIKKDVDEFPQFSENESKGHAAWTDWPWKLHRINGTTFELYNLLEDPTESTDLANSPEQQTRTRQMQKELDAWMRSVVRSINGDDYTTLTRSEPNWELVVADDFERTELGEQYTVPEKHKAGWVIENGVLVGRQVSPDHGSVIRRMLDFGDCTFECRFRFSSSEKGSRFNLVFDDSNDKSVHAGHISRVSVSRFGIKLSDDKTGGMNKEIRALRQLPNRTKEQQKELDQRLKTTTQQAKLRLKDDQWHKLWVQISGSQMTVKLDGKSVGSLDSPGINHATRDKFGLTVAAQKIEFDDWKLWVPANE